MIWELEFSEQFLKDIKKHQKSGNKILLKKIDAFLTEIRNNPKIGLGKTEKLKHFEVPIWSRKINDKHRLVYELKDDVVEILSGWVIMTTNKVIKSKKCFRYVEIIRSISS